MQRPIRVLHMPVNHASVMSTRVLAQRAIGVEARGFVFGEQPKIISSEGLTVMPPDGPLLKRYAWFLRQFLWADVVHWYGGNPVLPKGRDLGLLRRLRKPCVVEWLGSDVRWAEVELIDNPHFRQLWVENEEFRKIWPTCDTRSRQRQQRFRVVGAVPVVHPARFQYMIDIDEDVAISAMLGLDLGRFAVQPPRLEGSLVLAHAPSRRLIKGTQYIIDAVERLRAEGFDLDFRLVEGVEPAEALRIIQSADIFIDSLIMGNYGLASMEAMAMGKPVVCYVKESVRRRYPSDLPIVQAEPSTVCYVLRQLMAQRGSLERLARQSRVYVERHHDAVKCEQLMKTAYERVMANGR